MPLGKVAVGDRVLAAAASGAAVESRVIFVHDHVEASPTLRISYGVCVCVCVCVCSMRVCVLVPRAHLCTYCTGACVCYVPV